MLSNLVKTGKIYLGPYPNSIDICDRERFKRSLRGFKSTGSSICQKPILSS